jgi:pimeloyl-ACP methyl ester carboxylesterase
MAEYADRFWFSRDELKLHYRDYAGPDTRPPVLCLPGLTRNARDFSALADRLAGDWRVLCPDVRGRGDSAYAKDSATYNPQQYINDVTLLLDEIGAQRFVIIGTSLGGLMALTMALTMAERIAGAVINDVGPVVEPAGLERIRGYVGQGRTFPTWMHAARALEDSQSLAYPNYQTSDWLALAKRLMTLGGAGRIVFDYDMKIAEPLLTNAPGAQVDLWPGVDALAEKPVLVLRGALSDVFSAETFAAMQARLPIGEAITIADVGHAPTLDEPAAQSAIDRLMARVAKG